MKPTLGSDPELVAIATDARILDMHGFSRTLLDQPIPAYYALAIQDVDHVAISLPYGTLTPDGMAIEFTIEPSNDVDVMVERLHENLKATAALLTPRGIKLGVEPHFTTHQVYIDSLPEAYGKSCSLQILGCMPDFCVYSVELPERPDPKVYGYRTSGGHIHIEVGEAILNDRAALSYTVAALDSILGTAGTYLCKSKQAFDRKVLYGSAGMTRTNHERGTLEYRTLPAQALVQTPELARMMFTAAQTVAEHMMDVYAAESQPNAIKYFQEKVGTYAHLIGTLVPAINTHNIDACIELQEQVATRLSESVIMSVVNQLQTYRMPETFDLAWDLC